MEKPLESGAETLPRLARRLLAIRCAQRVHILPGENLQVIGSSLPNVSHHRQGVHERTFDELMTSDREFEAFREGSQLRDLKDFDDTRRRTYPERAQNVEVSVRRWWQPWEEMGPFLRRLFET